MNNLFAQNQRMSKLSKLGDPLVELDSLVDFAALAAVVDAKAPRTSSLCGRPAYATELMVRMIILQQFYGLSDDQVEYQVNDRSSFQRFLRLEHSSQIPDSKTLWAFRERIKKAEVLAGLFSEVKRQIGAKGYIARGGQVIDGTLIRAPVQHFTKEEKAILDQGNIPEDWSKAKRAQKDLDATWTQKHGKSYFGYKASVSVDVANKLIQTDVISTASAHDTKHFEEALDTANTSRLVLADKGYADGPRESRLKAAGWRLEIQRKAKKGKSLSACQAQRNKRIAKTRARGEHVFATVKQMGGGLVRTIGLARAKVQLTLNAMAYNFKRALFLVRRDAALGGSYA